MAKSPIFRVNYYVGAMLAQGGNIWVDEAALIFSPTSTLDRAMGAKDVQINFPEIRAMEFKGDLFRSFTVTTAEKTHKFEGSQAKQIWGILDGAVKAKPGPAAGPASAVKTAGTTSTPLVCDHCQKNLEPGFMFCPACSARIKAACPSCHKAPAPQWAACAFCGWKFR